MKKISLEDALHVAYKVINSEILGIKSAVINLYAEIDGDFSRRFGIEVNSAINDDQFKKVKLTFPKLCGLTLNQFNSLLNIFTEVRNINAHLYLSRKVELDSDIEDYLNLVYSPEYSVTKEHCLTIYGQAYIAMFLCQKNMIWGFATSFFKKWFIEFEGFGGDDISSHQIKFQHTYQIFCGQGKPIFNESQLPKKDLIYMNQLFRKDMTEFVLSLEEMIYPGKKSREYCKSFKNMIQEAFYYEEYDEAIDRIIIIRNCWLHGTYLYDLIEYKGQTVCFDYKFLFESLIIIKKWMIKAKTDFTYFGEILTKFGNACLCFYALRLIEVSYKLIDNRLLTNEKVEHRVCNSINAYQSILSAPRDFLEYAENLIEPDELRFKIKAAKCTGEKKQRSTKCDKLKIVKLHSENGFQIGDFYTNQTDLVLALVDLKDEYQNKINGIYVRDFFKVPTQMISNRIIVDEMNVNSISDTEPQSVSKYKQSFNQI